MNLKTKRGLNKIEISSGQIIKLWRSVSSFIGKLVILGLSLWIGDYVFHNIYSFNTERTIYLKEISEDLSRLRRLVEQLNSVAKSPYKDKDKLAQTIVDIATQENKIFDRYSATGFYFGQENLKKEQFLIEWANYSAYSIIKEGKLIREDIMDTLFFAVTCSMKAQLYSSHKHDYCNKLSALTLIQLKAYLKNIDDSFPIAEINQYKSISYDQVNNLLILAKHLQKN